ncbi:hypothetical protein MKX08_007972 [Trichoderma sp. CBMAI-0020]|nr:hypothetical protein MKX08_007972 [Trichoderma sp. CBMAI-0020]WOD45597.1 hypothetical protein [Trichoderma atroviride]
MGLASAPFEFDVQVDIFDQRWVTIFTQISFYFALTNDHDGGAYGNTGVFRIKRLDATPRMTIRDMRDSADAPSWDTLAQSDFYMTDLDEGLVAPGSPTRGGPAKRYQKSFSSRRPSSRAD